MQINVHPRNLKKTAMLTIAAMAAMGFARPLQAAPLYAVDVDVRVGSPPPRERVVVVEENWTAGPRRALYDADWRLRLAQTAEYQAGDDLAAARDREVGVAAHVDDLERNIDDLRHEMHRRESSVNASRQGLEQAERDAAAAKEAASLTARKADDAKADLDETRRSGRPEFGAAARFHRAAAAAASAEADLDAALGRLDEVRRGGASSTSTDFSTRLQTEESRLDRAHDDLYAAHDAVYAAQHRLDDAHHDVCVALHDRDEALWMLHRDDIISGARDPEAYGFVIENGFFRRHRYEPEVLHSYCVRDTAYWIERPVEVHTRIVEVEHVTEITRVREVERVREVKIKEVERVETRYQPEQRRHFAETLQVEHGAYTKEQQERVLAVKENRKPQVQSFIVKSKSVGSTVSNTGVTSTGVTSTPRPDGRRNEPPVTAIKPPLSTGGSHSTVKDTEGAKVHRNVPGEDRTTSNDPSKSSTVHTDSASTAHGTVRSKTDEVKKPESVKPTETVRPDRSSKTVTPVDPTPRGTGGRTPTPPPPPDGSSGRTSRHPVDPSSTGNPPSK